MSYQSLYRTWRPRTFSEMVGQEAIVRSLKNQSDSKRIAHAYLFCGSRGTGKTSAARIMALAINCQNPQQGDPCLVCESCTALQNETTLDVFEMDAASNSRVEEIREMLSRTDYPPQFVKYKVYIIDEVHMLSNSAFNALLKTLEEPPAYMVFILATTEPQKLPATILSRCQRFDFGRIPESLMIARLKLALQGGISAEEGALQQIASAAQGSMRDAWSLMDMCLGAGKQLTEENVRFMLGAVSQDFLYDFLDSLLVQDSASALKLTDKLLRDGRDAQVFFREFNAFLRQVLAVKWTGAGMSELGQDQLQRLKQKASQADADLLLFFLEKCMQSEYEARWSASPRAVLELFALRCTQLGKARDESSLQARLGSLETRLNSLSSDTARPAPAAPPVKHEQPVSPAKEEIPQEPAMPGRQEPNPQPDDVQPQFVPDFTPQQLTAVPIDEPAQAEEPAIKPRPALASSPKEAWNNLLKRLQKDNYNLYAMVSRGRYGGFADQTFSLQLASEDEIFASLLNDTSRRDPIEAILSEEMGHKALFRAAGREPASKQEQEQQKDEQLEALSQVFGRDKIVLKND